MIQFGDRIVFTVSFSIAAVLYTLCACAVIFGLWLFYDMRDRRMYDLERRKTIFHCIRCDHLYAARAGEETCRCPRCEFENGRLRF